MKVLLSIKPQFAEKIFEGSKKYEFRKNIFKQPEIKTIVVYASSPIQKVIGEFTIEKIISDQLDNLWKLTAEHSGISEEFFYEYFEGKDNGYAIKIKSVRKYPIPYDLKGKYNMNPPQSFAYLLS